MHRVFHPQLRGARAILRAQAFLQRTNFTRLRIHMLEIHVLARGFLMRKQIVTKYKSLRLMQVRCSRAPSVIAVNRAFMFPASIVAAVWGGWYACMLRTLHDRMR